jgi:hypothetical protein
VNARDPGALLGEAGQVDGQDIDQTIEETDRIFEQINSFLEPNEFPEPLARTLDDGKSKNPGQPASVRRGGEECPGSSVAIRKEDAGILPTVGTRFASTVLMHS